MSQMLDDLALLYPCGSCGAAAGEWCVTFKPYRLEPGKPAIWLHTARTGPIWQAYQEGSTQGAANVAGHVRRLPPDDEWLVRFLDRCIEAAS